MTDANLVIAAKLIKNRTPPTTADFSSTNATAMFFKRISDADITSYPIQFFSTGTLFMKVIKIIDQHD